MTKTSYRIDRVPGDVSLMPSTDGPGGCLLVEGVVARPGIYEYVMGDGTVRRELVPRDALWKVDSIETLARSPVTLEHPTEMVTPENVRSYVHGDVGEEVIEAKGGFVKIRMAIRTKEAMAATERGKIQLSPGYKVDILEESGEDPEFGKYDAIQIGREYNHVAIVDSARGGDVCLLRIDSAEVLVGKPSGASAMQDKTNEEMKVDQEGCEECEGCEGCEESRSDAPEEVVEDSPEEVVEDSPEEVEEDAEEAVVEDAPEEEAAEAEEAPEEAVVEDTPEEEAVVEDAPEAEEAEAVEEEAEESAPLTASQFVEGLAAFEARIAEMFASLVPVADSDARADSSGLPSDPVEYNMMRSKLQSVAADIGIEYRQDATLADISREIVKKAKPEVNFQFDADYIAAAQMVTAEQPTVSKVSNPEPVSTQIPTIYGPSA